MTEEIDKTLNYLKSGKIILYPTDTIWGIGCDATLPKPIERIFKLKQRHDKKSMILLLDEPGKLSRYVSQVPPIAFDLIERYSEPLTIVYPGARNLAKNVIAGDGTIAIRIVRDEFCRRLIAALDKPIVSTSANVSNSPAPITYSRISEEIRKGVDYIVDHNRNTVLRTKASTIIRILDTGEFEILRK
jgi:L-threonylcarbamoyladenylate synthase